MATGQALELRSPPPGDVLWLVKPTEDPEKAVLVRAHTAAEAHRLSGVQEAFGGCLVVDVATIQRTR